MTNKLIALSIGGILGTISRFIVNELAIQHLGLTFPFGTFLVNITGCLIIGFLAGFGENRFVHIDTIRLLLFTGFCGAYTTFSTLMLDADNLLQSNQWGKSVIYVAGSFIVGYTLFRLGLWIGKLL